jgi:hypothetical protein
MENLGLFAYGMRLRRALDSAKTALAKNFLVS